ncbi:hypothetical protein Tco_0521460, partial [Tanacetum coccineum]
VSCQTLDVARSTPLDGKRLPRVRFSSKSCKKYRVGGVPKSHGEDIDEGVL